MPKPVKDFLLTKIVATLGPACADPGIIEQMILSGVRVFRINFSHGTFGDYTKLYHHVREKSVKLDIPIGVLGDLSGPKIRVGKVAGEGVFLSVGQMVVFQRDVIVTQTPEKQSDPVVFSTTFEQFIDEVQPGEKILLDDGYVRLSCLEKNNDRLLCQVVDGGLITSSKGVNLPDSTLSVSALTQKDIKCVEFAVEKRFDFLALSFVRKGEDVKLLKEKLRELGARPGTDPPLAEQVHLHANDPERERLIPVISKIEKPQAVENLGEIVRETDAVMVARGDLGVEMDLAEVAVIQKRIIKMCHEYGMPVIVATQMLQSMIDHASPTRAEISDVANAIFDGADAVMLSGETAVGKYPVEAVRMMNRIAERTNRYLKTQPFVSSPPRQVLDVHRRTASIASSVRTIAEEMDVKFFIVWSQLGGAAVYLSQQRMPRPILFFSPSETILRRTCLLYALEPIYMPKQTSNTGFFQTVDRLLLENNWTEQGDTVVFVLAEPITRVGVANEIVIHRVGDPI